MKTRRIFRFLFARIAAVVLLIVAVLLAADKGIEYLGKQIFPQKYSEYVQKYCAEYNVGQDLCYAVIKCSSGFENGANNGEKCGLMQLKAEDFNRIYEGLYNSPPKDGTIFEPEYNIRCGVWYIHELCKEFADTGTALTAYFAGADTAKQWLQNSEYSADGKTFIKLPDEKIGRLVKKITTVQGIYSHLYREKTETEKDLQKTVSGIFEKNEA